MSSYFRRLISRGIVDIIKSRIDFKLTNEEKLLKAFYQRIALRVPMKIPQGNVFRLRVTNPNILQVFIPKDLYRNDAPNLQLKNFSDGLITGFSLRPALRKGDPPQITISVNEFELRKRGLNQILRARENYGYASVRDEGNKQTVFIECPSGPVSNLGPFHCMDLYTAILANVLANMYEAAGYKVIKCLYVCDHRHAFACLYQGLKEKGDTEQFNRNPVPQFYEICQEMMSACSTNETKKRNVGQLMRNIREEDKSVMADVKKTRDVVSTENKKTFERLGIHFTHTEWESMYHSWQRHFRTFKTKNQCIPERGVIALEDRYEKYQFDLMFYSGFQTFQNIGTYLQNKDGWKLDSQLFDFIQEGKVDTWAVCFDLAIVDKQKKSTEECLNSAKQQVMDALRSQGDPENIENIEEVAEVIGNTCVIIQTILSTNSRNQRTGIYENIENGMFLQYVHARLSQLLSLNADVNVDELLEVSDDIIKSLEEPEACRLILQMCRYEEIFENTLIKRCPAFVVDYLFKLVSCINDCLDRLTVKTQSHDLDFSRLVLFTCAKTVFSNGLHLLGIKPLDKIWSEVPVGLRLPEGLIH